MSKRPLPARVAQMLSRKRQRLAEGRDASSLHSAAKKRKPTKSAVRVNDLAWKAVSMPDRIDDFEGFFGLEEADDVDVLKNEASGQISFVAPSDDAQQQQNRSSDRHNGLATDPPLVEGGWEGFGDDGGVSANTDKKAPMPVKKKATKQKATKQKATKQKATKQTPGRKPAKTTSESVQSAFICLEDQAKASEMDVSAWTFLNLSPDTLSSLSRLNFSKPTPIQQSAIPAIRAGQDVIGKASTGSGKTLAFGIPILERFLELRASPRKDKAPLALILSPTRELAHQLRDHLTALCSNGTFAGPSIATLTGGLSLQKQQRQLKDADLVIGTPGRLWDVISSGQGVMGQLKKIEFLVVDEADRLLSAGHFREVEEILNAIEREDEQEESGDVAPKTDEDGQAAAAPRQTLVFSATFDASLQQKLASRSKTPMKSPSALTNKQSLSYLISALPFRSPDPTFLDANPTAQLPPELAEGLIECSATEKDLYLYTLLLLHPHTRALVFVNSIAAARRLPPFLAALGLAAHALHSGMAQKARLRALDRFSSADTSSVLVATDLAARGLDLPRVRLVLHYHLPRAADAYVHRAGRTARAGARGASVLLCAAAEAAGLRRLVASVHGAGGGRAMRALAVDRAVVARMKPHAALAKRIADVGLARERGGRGDEVLRVGAEELGVEFDGEVEGLGKGRGRGRMERERRARGVGKAELAAMRAELRALLRVRVNVGVSERYLTGGGGVDVDELLRQQGAGGKGGEFLGAVGALGLDD